MGAPRKETSIRDDTVHFDTRIPSSLMRRMHNAAIFLGLTKRGAYLIVMNEGCAVIERQMQNARQAREQESDHEAV